MYACDKARSSAMASENSKDICPVQRSGSLITCENKTKHENVKDICPLQRSGSLITFV
jgi:hypothetical protein